MNTNLSDTALTGGQHASTEVPPTNQATPGQAASHTQASNGSSAAEKNNAGKIVQNTGKQYGSKNKVKK